jgi:uncharacterized membrane protein HdeD (DUF308 family)
MAVTVNEASAVLRAAVRDTIRRRSLVFPLQGLGLAAAGVLALFFPAFMGTGVTVLIGWLLIVSGIVQAVSLIGVTQVPYFWLDLIAAALAILVGWILVARPEAGLVAITFLMLVFFMVSGLQRVIFALMVRPMPDWGWLLASGLVAIGCALVLFTNLPEAAGWLLGLLLGVQLIVTGGAMAWMAWRLRRAASSGV